MPPPGPPLLCLIRFFSRISSAIETRSLDRVGSARARMMSCLTFWGSRPLRLLELVPPPVLLAICKSAKMSPGTCPPVLPREASTGVLLSCLFAVPLLLLAPLPVSKKTLSRIILTCEDRSDSYRAALVGTKSDVKMTMTEV